MGPFTMKFSLLNQREELHDESEPDLSDLSPPQILETDHQGPLHAPSLLQSALSRMCNEPLSGIASVLVLEIRVLVVLYSNDRIVLVRALLDNAYGEGKEEEFVLFVWSSEGSAVRVSEGGRWVAKKSFKWLVSRSFSLWVVQDAFVSEWAIGGGS